jgi:hypothetical protein
MTAAVAQQLNSLLRLKRASLLHAPATAQPLFSEPHGGRVAQAHLCNPSSSSTSATPLLLATPLPLLTHHAPPLTVQSELSGVQLSEISGAHCGLAA